MDIQRLDEPLTPEQRIEVLRIAHETTDPMVKRIALGLLNPLWVMGEFPEYLRRAGLRPLTPDGANGPED